MTGFKIITKDKQEIRFDFYLRAAPVTSKSFAKKLPFTRTFYHARVSGQEIWIDDVSQLDIIQENASVFTEPGEVVFGPTKPARSKQPIVLEFIMVKEKGWTPVIFSQK